jgi:hypothetical protein
MNQARLYTILVAAVMAAYALVGFYFLPLASFEGNLTRMAKLPESYFGWTRPQPAIDPRLMRSAPWQDADVLVIGDSFSYAQLWQTVFAQKGVRVRTETWESVFNICGDFSDWLRSTGFKGRYIVIESVEAYFEDRVARSLECRHMEYHTPPQLATRPPSTLPDRHSADYSGRLSVGIETELNARRYDRLSSLPGFKGWDEHGEASVERVENGCKLFSHPRCRDVLFYAKDRVQDMGENILDGMAGLDARMKDYTVAWVVIPDKSTVYLHPDKRFWDLAEQRFHAPNLLKAFRQQVQKQTIDLYPANNTHVSTTGYLILGDAIYRSMYR